MNFQKKLLKDLMYQIVQLEEQDLDPNEKSWGYERGVLLSQNEAKYLTEILYFEINGKELSWE